MIDDRTAILGIKIPSLSNELEDDVWRLREAFSDLDFKLAGAVDAPSATASYTGGVLTSVSETLPGGATRTTAYAYDGEGRIVTATATIGASTMRTTYTYSANGLASWSTIEITP